MWTDPWIERIAYPRPQELMPSNTVRAGIALAGSLVFYVATPAYAGWGNSFVHGVLPSLVKRAAVSLIQQELYDLESRQSSGNYQPDNEMERGFPQPPMIMHQGGSRDPRSISAKAKSETFAISRTAPPSGYKWTPRSAVDYLPDGDEQGIGGVREDRSKSAAFQAFIRGAAGNFSYDQLVAAKVFVSEPLHGSIFKRQGRVKYIILHSTETGSPADARRVIQSWNNRGQRHPGAQFVVDRDGTICSTANPDLATVHINTSKTLPGYSNDNSVGIEIVRSGKQRYTRPQLDSVLYLVSYLQSHYNVSDDDVTTHHHVQPSDRSDPVGFDLVAFESAKSSLRSTALAQPASQPRYSGRGQAEPARASRAPSAPERIFSSPDSPTILSAMPKPAPDFRHLRGYPQIGPLSKF